MPTPRRTAGRAAAALAVALLAGCASQQAATPSSPEDAEASVSPTPETTSTSEAAESSPEATTSATDPATEAETFAPEDGESPELEAGDQSQRSAETGVQALTQESIDADQAARERAAAAAERGDATVALTWVETDGGHLNVGALVENVVTQDGVCTLTLTRGSEVLIAESSAVTSASSTSCGDLGLDLAGAQSGPWSLSVAFSAPDAGGVSDAQEVMVP